MKTRSKWPSGAASRSASPSERTNLTSAGISADVSRTSLAQRSRALMLAMKLPLPAPRSSTAASAGM